jgi:hypothetical protein
MVRGAVDRDVKEVVLIQLIGDPGNRTRFRVAQLPFRHGRRYARQFFHRTRHSKLLARGAEVDSALPVKPMSTRLHAPFGPCLATIEFRYERQEAGICSIQMPGQFRDPGNQIGGRDTRNGIFHDELRQAVFIYSSLPEIIAIAST